MDQRRSLYRLAQAQRRSAGETSGNTWESAPDAVAGGGAGVAGAVVDIEGSVPLLAEVPLPCDPSSLAPACCAFEVGKLASAWSIRERTMTTAFMLTTWTHAVKILVQ